MPEFRGGRTLVIQPLPGIGDLIWHLPFLHAIAAQAAEGRISLLTKRRARADLLLKHDPAIADILWLDREAGPHRGVTGMLRLARELRRDRFDAVWILHQSMRYALIARLAGIPCRIGYGTGRQAWFLSRGRHLPVHRKSVHPIEAGQLLLRRLGVPLTEREPHLRLGSAQQDAARRRWQPRAGGVNIVLGIGSSEAWKIWPRERFLELMQRLARARPCRFYLMGGGAGEQRIAAWILEQARAAGIDAVAALDHPLDEAVHLVSLNDLYIGNDTGLLNIAVAVGIPALGLFGASPPLTYSALIHPVVPPGGGCTGMDRSGAGMRELSVDRVFARSVELMAGTGHG